MANNPSKRENIEVPFELREKIASMKRDFCNSVLSDIMILPIDGTYYWLILDYPKGKLIVKMIASEEYR